MHLHADNEYLKQALEFLGRDNVTISDKILVEKFGETLYKETGFTDVAETINGRSAVRSRQVLFSKNY